MIYAAMVVMIIIAIYSGYRRKVHFQEMESWYFLLLFIISIATNFLLLYNTFFHSKFVPGDLKGGMYGLMGGASFGAIMLNMMISSFLLGLLLSYLSKKNTDPKGFQENDEASTKGNFPEWFNRLSHSLSGCIVGSAFGIGLLSIFKGKPLDDLGGFAIGSVIGLAGLYSIGGVVVIIQKLIDRK